MKQIYVVLQIETDNSVAIVVNAFESQDEAKREYPDMTQYEIVAINLNEKGSQNETGIL